MLTATAVPTLAVFEGTNAYRYRGTAQIPWESVVGTLSKFAETPDKATRNQSADYFSPVRLYPGRAHRSDLDVEALTIACFDVDKCTPEDVATSRRLIAEAGYAQHWYSSFSHSPEYPAYRLLIPITHELSAAAWKVVRAKMVDQFLLKVEAGKCENISHGYFAPVLPPGGKGETFTAEGKPFDTAGEAAQYPPGSMPPNEPKNFELPPEPDGSLDLSAPRGLMLAAAALHRSKGAETKAVLLERLVIGEILTGGVVQSESGDPPLASAIALMARAAPGLSLGTYKALVDASWRKAVEDGSDIPESRVDSKIIGILKKIALENEAREAEEAADKVLLGVLGIAGAPPVGPEPVVDFAALVAQAREELRIYLGDRTRASARDLGLPLTFGEARQTEWTGTPWLVESVLQQQALGQVVSGSKTGKTWLVLDLALSIVTGVPLFGHFPTRKQGRVLLWLTEDQREDAVNRIEALISAKQLSPELAPVIEQNLVMRNRQKFDIENDGELAQIVARIRQMGPFDLVVFDPLRNVSDAEEKDSTAMKGVLDRFIAIRDLTGCSVLYTHHTTKPTPATMDDPRSPGDRGRGSTHITAAVDVTIAYLTCDKTSEDGVISTLVNVDPKNAKGAGTFALRLQINGTADRATEAWYTYSKADLDKDPKKTSKHLGEIREFIKLEYVKDPKALFAINSLVSALKIGTDKRRVSALMNKLVELGVAEFGPSNRGIRYVPGTDAIVVGSPGANYLEDL